MREREPAPQEHVDERDGRRPQRPDDALRLASQMGNVAFTALARSVARRTPVAPGVKRTYTRHGSPATTGTQS